LVQHDNDTVCTSLEDRFNGSSLYEANIVHETVGDPETTGSLDIWYSNPTYVGSIDGEEIASASGVCTLLNNSTAFQCTGVLVFLDTGDTITYVGEAPGYLLTGNNVITGGTGCYEGSHGTIRMKPLQINEPYDYFQWDYDPEVINSTCKTLDAIFGGGVLFEEAADDEITADDGNLTASSASQPAGEIGTWWNYPMKRGSIDGEVIGSTMGLCVFLPESSHMNCILQIIFDGYGTISVEGIYPVGLNTPGELAITGGTGCFEGIGGTISQTALEVETPFDAWQWSLVSLADSSNMAPTMAPTSKAAPWTFIKATGITACYFVFVQNMLF
jgi:hypothetical protein